MENVKRIETVTVFAAVILSATAVVFGSPAAMACPELARWISVGAFMVDPLALLAVSVCCAGIYLVGALRNIKKQRVPAFVCSAAVSFIAALCILLSLFSMLPL